LGLTPAAKAKQLKSSREWKQDKRAISDSFVEKEKVYRRKYARRKYAQAKIAISFCKAVPDLFAKWVKEGSSAVAHTVDDRARHMPATSTPTSAPAPVQPLFTPMPAPLPPLDDGSRRVPSAKEMEYRRLGSAKNTLAEFGIRLD
jgi:hypothetical protein